MGFWDGSSIRWTICKLSAPRFRQITTPTPHRSIFTGLILFLTPDQQRQSTEGNSRDSSVVFKRLIRTLIMLCFAVVWFVWRVFQQMRSRLSGQTAAVVWQISRLASGTTRSRYLPGYFCLRLTAMNEWIFYLSTQIQYSTNSKQQNCVDWTERRKNTYNCPEQ